MNTRLVPREGLFTFIAENQVLPRPDLIALARKAMEPFFANAGKGKHTLAQARELDAREIERAIATATGKGVTKIAFVSFSHPREKPIRMTYHAYWDSLKDRLEASLGDILWDSLKDTLKDIYWDGLLDGIWKILMDSFEDSFEDSLWFSFGDNVWDSLHYFLGFVLAGREEEVRRLLPLIKLLPRAIPIGEEEDKPGMWLVLVA